MLGGWHHLPSAFLGQYSCHSCRLQVTASAQGTLTLNNLQLLTTYHSSSAGALYWWMKTIGRKPWSTA